MLLVWFLVWLKVLGPSQTDPPIVHIGHSSSDTCSTDVFGRPKTVFRDGLPSGQMWTLRGVNGPPTRQPVFSSFVPLSPKVEPSLHNGKIFHLLHRKITRTFEEWVYDIGLESNWDQNDPSSYSLYDYLL